MRLVCPSCSAVHSAEAFLNDDAARQCLVLLSKVQFPAEIVNYLGLFRTRKGQGLRWSRALKLLAEILELIKAADIKWDGRKAYKNCSAFWKEALEKVVEKPPKTLPLENNNYLRAIAYSIADNNDARREKEKEKELAFRSKVSSGRGFTSFTADPVEEIDPEKVGQLIQGVIKKMGR